MALCMAAGRADEHLEQQDFDAELARLAEWQRGRGAVNSQETT